MASGWRYTRIKGLGMSKWVLYGSHWVTKGDNWERCLIGMYGERVGAFALTPAEARAYIEQQLAKNEPKEGTGEGS